jgi:hypothetical protein
LTDGSQKFKREILRRNWWLNSRVGELLKRMPQAEDGAQWGSTCLSYTRLWVQGSIICQNNEEPGCPEALKGGKVRRELKENTRQTGDALILTFFWWEGG